MWKTYYQLTKPGIIYGNALAAIAGFLLASKDHVDVWLLLALLSGVSLVIASGCVFNNYIDRGIDKKMARTRQRALVLGAIPGKRALLYAVCLGLVGFLVLIAFTNLLTVVIGIIGFIDYVVAYGYYKRRSVYGTLVGSISGATPPVAGYTAVTGHFDMAALLLFLILALWQMPHFYAIAMYRFNDYKAAGLPVLPVKKGMFIAKINIVAYIAAFTISCILLTVYGYTGYTFLIIMAVLGIVWLWSGLRGIWSPVDDRQWARGMFLKSLIVLCVWCLTIVANALLP